VPGNEVPTNDLQTSLQTFCSRFAWNARRRARCQDHIEISIEFFFIYQQPENGYIFGFVHPSELLICMKHRTSNRSRTRGARLHYEVKLCEDMYSLLSSFPYFVHSPVSFKWTKPRLKENSTLSQVRCHYLTKDTSCRQRGCESL
jgi:hypothetical protein